MATSNIPTKGTNAYHSAAGSRGYVNFALLPTSRERYSVASIAMNNVVVQTRNPYRTWWYVEDFDNQVFKSSTITLHMLPCDTASFSLGNTLYKTAEDAVPGTMRVKASRCEAYSFDVAFPIIISAETELNAVYNDLFTAVTDATYMVTLATSIQNRHYPSIVEKFTISADGYNGANPINCHLTTKGLSSHINENEKRRSILTGPSDLANPILRDKTTRTGTTGTGWNTTYTPQNIGLNAANYGGRIANIKDCALRLDTTSYSQIVKMELNIQNSLIYKSTAAPQQIERHPTIRSEDRIYMIERQVTGSFTFLSSYATEVNLNGTGIGTFDASKYSLAATDKHGAAQWATPLWMQFGPLHFHMPAVYWQPRSEEMSTGSPLVTINFIARSNIYGISEFAAYSGADYSVL